VKADALYPYGHPDSSATAARHAMYACTLVTLNPWTVTRMRMTTDRVVSIIRSTVSGKG